MATQTVEIVVPEGLCPGDAFDVEWGGVNYNIAVPDGCFGGIALNIELPALDQPVESAADAPPAMTAVEIVVPDSLGPGDAFDVEWGGVNYNIAVPDGCFGGTALNIELPSLDQPTAAEPPPLPVPDEPCTRECLRKCRRCDGLKFKPDQKVEMMMDDGSMSPGYIVGKGWQDRCGYGPTYKVLLDEGVTKEAVSEDDIIKAVTVYDTKKLAKVLPCTKGCTNSCTQCDGMKFKPDQKVEVVRTDGAMSPGYIVGKGWEGFDGPTYKVQLDDGMCKQAVPEDEISDEVCDVGALF